MIRQINDGKHLATRGRIEDKSNSKSKRTLRCSALIWSSNNDSKSSDYLYFVDISQQQRKMQCVREKRGIDRIIFYNSGVGSILSSGTVTLAINSTYPMTEKKNNNHRKPKKPKLRTQNDVAMRRGRNMWTTSSKGAMHTYEVALALHSIFEICIKNSSYGNDLYNGIINETWIQMKNEHIRLKTKRIEPSLGRKKESGSDANGETWVKLEVCAHI